MENSVDIVCSSCGSKFKIREEKLPVNQIVKITCPKCKHKITVDTRGHADQANLEEKGAGRKALPGYDDFASPLGFMEGGIRLALIVDDNDMHKVDIDLAINELAYKPISASSIPEAMEKLLLHHFDLIILSEEFDGKDIENNPITKHLNKLSMSTRRQMFLVLLGDQFNTMDNMMAFGASANLVVNPSDLPDLTLILKKAMNDNNQFYKVFTDTLREIGKI